MKFIGMYFHFLLYYLAPSVGILLGGFKIQELWFAKEKEWKELNEFTIFHRIFLALVVAPISIICMLMGLIAILEIFRGESILKW